MKQSTQPDSVTEEMDVFQQLIHKKPGVDQKQVQAPISENRRSYLDIINGNFDKTMPPNAAKKPDTVKN